MRRTGWTRTSVLQVYLAQSLYKAGMYPEATRAAVRVDSPQYQQRMIALQVCVVTRVRGVACCRAHTRDVDRVDCDLAPIRPARSREKARERERGYKVYSDWLCTSTSTNSNYFHV